MQDSHGTPRTALTSADIARAALTAFGAIAAGVTVIAVIESYSNLLAFALAYGLAGWRAVIAPGAVDSFIVMGELLLFAAVLLRWGKLPHVLGIAMAAWGFLLSVGGNIWHAHAATPVDRAVAAIWPVLATAALAGTLLIVRQVTTSSGAPAIPPARAARRGTGPAAARAAKEQAVLARLLASGEPLPSARQLGRDEFGSYQSKSAKNVLIAARAAQNGGSHD
jgi:hypothetical protein